MARDKDTQEIIGPLYQTCHIEDVTTSVYPFPRVKKHLTADYPRNVKSAKHPHNRLVTSNIHRLRWLSQSTWPLRGKKPSEEYQNSHRGR